MKTCIEDGLRRSQVNMPNERRGEIRHDRSALSLAQVQWGWPLMAESELVYAASAMKRCSPDGGTVRLQS